MSSRIKAANHGVEPIGEYRRRQPVCNLCQAGRADGCVQPVGDLRAGRVRPGQGEQVVQFLLGAPSGQETVARGIAYSWAPSAAITHRERFSGLISTLSDQSARTPIDAATARVVACQCTASDLHERFKGALQRFTIGRTRSDLLDCHKRLE